MKPNLAYRFVKRCFDICSSGIALIVLIPVWIIAIVLIDFFGSGSLFDHGSHWNFLKWLYNFAYHLIVLGALLVLQN